MTRLISTWIEEIENSAGDWSRELAIMTGLGYAELMALSAGCTAPEIIAKTQEMTALSVPVTQGEGIIGSFSQSVAAIAGSCGFDAGVTQRGDVDGLYEAICRGADLCLMADDDRYIALNLKNGRTGDNNEATAFGYAKLLDGLARTAACEQAGGLGNGPQTVCDAQYGGQYADSSFLKDREVLVMGYGIIGKLMARELSEMGARVFVFERDEARLAEAAGDGFSGFADKEELRRFKYVADGTNTGGWLSADELHEEVLLAAPGIPFSLDDDSAQRLKGRYIHDMLEIGTVCMLGQALR